MSESNVKVVATKPLESGIRHYAKGDLPGIMELEDIAYRPIDKDEFLRMVYAATSDCWVAESGRQVVGYAIGTSKGNSVNLTRIVVHPDYERRGIATRLVRRFEARTQSSQRMVEAIVPERRTDVQELLKKCGYSCCAVHRYQYSDPMEDGYTFRKSFIPDDIGFDFAVYSPTGRRLQHGSKT